MEVILKIMVLKCFVLNNGKYPIGKMDVKCFDETIFMGYALHSKAYRVFNKSSLIVEESMYVIFFIKLTLHLEK